MDSSKIKLKGSFIRLRLVCESDAEFIIKVRTNGENSKFINATSEDLSLQRRWIANEKLDKSSFYFIIESIAGENIGTISLYNISDNQGEFGRWICDGNAIESLESAYLIHKFAFEYLGLDLVYTRTLSKNKKVVSFHRSFGATISNEAVYEPEFEQEIIKGTVDKNVFDSISHRVETILGCL